MNTLRAGDVGDNVRELQSRLNTILALDPPLRVDGHFGALTRAAVLAYQSSSVGPDGSPLVADGIVGPVTWWALTMDNQGAAHTGQLYGFPTGTPRCALAREVLTVLGDQIGAREIGRNNAGPDVAAFAGGRQDVPWCAWFVTWVVNRAAERCDAASPLSHQGSARRVLRELADAGLVLADGETPEAGDVVVWWRGTPDGWQGHVEREKRLLGFAKLCA